LIAPDGMLDDAGPGDGPAFLQKHGASIVV